MLLQERGIQKWQQQQHCILLKRKKIGRKCERMRALGYDIQQKQQQHCKQRGNKRQFLARDDHHRQRVALVAGLMVLVQCSCTIVRFKSARTHKSLSLSSSSSLRLLYSMRTSCFVRVCVCVCEQASERIHLQG